MISHLSAIFSRLRSVTSGSKELSENVAEDATLIEPKVIDVDIKQVWVGILKYNNGHVSITPPFTTKKDAEKILNVSPATIFPLMYDGIYKYKTDGEWRKIV